MLKNAFAYVTRKSLKSLIILLVILSMSTLSLISLSIKDATNKASEETFGNITNSFTMEINRRVNQGTPRGGGNVRGQDIKKIVDSGYVDNFVKRINSVADLDDNLSIVEAPGTEANQSAERAKNFKRTVMLTGVNNSTKETKFVSGVYKLVEGEHLNSEDKNKILMHKDLAAKNNLKIGDTATYQDATFFVKGNKNLDDVIKDLKKLDINWRAYNLIKSSSNFPALQKSISGIYAIANQLFAGSLIFAGIVVTLLLFLWMNARKKEIAVLLSIGMSKTKIFGQFAIELILVTIPAFIGSYFLAGYTGKILGNSILKRVTGSIAKQIAKQSTSTKLGGGAEVDGFNKTLTSLNVTINPKSLLYVVLFMSLILVIALAISSLNILRKKPKDLLIDTK